MPANQSAFPLRVVEGDGRVIVRFPANTTLSEANAEEFANEFLALAAGRERPHLLVDLGAVALLTGAVLGKFVALHGRVRAAGGRLTLFNPTPVVRQAFELTRLDTVLDVRTPAQRIPA